MKQEQVLLFTRSVEAVRSFFSSLGFVEVFCPLIVPFTSLDRNVFPIPVSNGFLITSPEYVMKRYLSWGLDNIVYIGKVFRKEEEGALHHQEFTMIEWYRQGVDYSVTMEDTERLCMHLAEALGRRDVLPPLPWERLKVRDVFKDVVDIDICEFDQTGHFYREARKLGVPEMENPTWEDVFFSLFVSFVEPYIKEKEACFLVDWPRILSSQAQVCEDNPFFVERFELFIRGVEIANGYTELTDADELRKRFEEEAKIRESQGEPVVPDWGLVKLLEQGFPCASGVSVGLERLLMVILGKSSVSDVVPIDRSSLIW